MTTMNFYDKEQVDTLLVDKADADDVYDKEAIDDLEIGAPDDAASSSGSLWARIKNAVARIISLENADANNVKKTGTNNVTGTIEVPTTPPTPTSVVNSVYVNDATEGVNNISHKTGNETIAGDKLFTGNLQVALPYNYDSLPSTAYFKSLFGAKYPGKSNHIMLEVEESSAYSNLKLVMRIIRNGELTNAYRQLSLYYDNATNITTLRTNAYRTSTNKADYDNSEVVTIQVLKNLGLI